MAAPCVFYAKRGCRQGSSCRFSHISPIPSTDPIQLRGDAGEFAPASHEAGQPSLTQSVRHLSVSTTPCHFFLQGRCRYGHACIYTHSPIGDPETKSKDDSEADITQSGPANFTEIDAKDVSEGHVEDKVDTPGKPKSDSQVTRSIAGAHVSFKDGAEVAAVALNVTAAGPSDRLQMSTVSCSWYKPSKVAWLHYRTEKWASYAVERFGKERKVKGREVQSKLIRPPHHHVRKPIWSVQLGNLPIDTSNEDLEVLLKGIKPDNILFGKASYTTSEASDCDIVKKALTKYGTLISFETSHGLNAARMKALARFETASDAKTAAAALSGLKMPAFGGSSLFVNLIASVKLVVLKELYDVVSRDIRILEASNAKVRITCFPPEREGKPAVLRMLSEDVGALAKAKASLEHLLSGKIVYNEGGYPCWHKSFSSKSGLTYLRGLNQPGRAFIYRDMRRQILSFHGAPALFEPARQAILSKTTESSALIHCLPLSPDLLQKAFAGGFRRIIDVFGKQKAKLDVTKQPPVVTISGTSDDFERAKTLLDLHSEDREVLERIGEECPACMSEPDDPKQLSCKHTYCHDCLCGLCQAADNSNLPLRCFGDEGKCKQTITLSDLKSGLTHYDFESLLDKAFELYVQAHPYELRYCLTPDCASVYQVTSNGSTTTCSRCLSLICTTCHIISHEGLTCEQNKDTIAGDKALRAWKKESGAQDCPNCKALIEKSVGCNHMTCYACRTHFCWVCLKVCADTEIYEHMRTAHGGIGL